MIVIEPFAAGLSAPAEYAHILIKLILIFLAFGILAGRAVYPESNLWTYLTPVGLGLILLMVHVFMPQLAGLPKDNPKRKTMRRINLLTMGVILGLFLAHRFVPEKVYEDKNRFLLPFSVAVVLLVGNAAPKIPVNPVMGIRLPWGRAEKDGDGRAGQGGTGRHSGTGSRENQNAYLYAVVRCGAVFLV